LIQDVVATQEDVGRFLWSGDNPLEIVPFRHATADGDRRGLDEIAMQELAGLALSMPGLPSADDPPLAMAKQVGLSRISKPARDRLEAALELAINSGLLAPR
jgi:hypothetical protein